MEKKKGGGDCTRWRLKGFLWPSDCGDWNGFGQYQTMVIKMVLVTIRLQQLNPMAIKQQHNSITIKRSILILVVIDGLNSLLVTIWEPSYGNQNMFCLFDGERYSKGTWRYMSF
jgi:hypothetical protein